MSVQSNLWFKFLSPERVNASKETDTKNLLAAYRTAFDIDFDRIVFSRSFRNLQQKTQVHSTTGVQNSHNRLTHSLEVACVARSLGKKVGQELIKREVNVKVEELELLPHLFGSILAAAALTHDIGNPPFGHYGENLISSFFKDKIENTTLKDRLSEVECQDLSDFEGNAQGFRLLTRSKDLSLTFATLAAFIKYPCSSTEKDAKGKRKSRHKFGYFDTEKDIFNQVALKSQLPKHLNENFSRHPLAFLVEAADDICYNIIDLEDAYHLGILSFDDTMDLLYPLVGSRYNKEKIDKIHFEYDKIGVFRAMSVNALVSAVAYTFIDYTDDILNGTFDRDLISLCTFSDSLVDIKKVSKEKIYSGKDVVNQELRNKKILNEILKTLYYEIIDKKCINVKSKVVAQVFKWINPVQFKENRSTYSQIRALIDYVCSMTERQCLDFPIGKIKS